MFVGDNKVFIMSLKRLMGNTKKPIRNYEHRSIVPDSFEWKKLFWLIAFYSSE